MQLVPSQQFRRFGWEVLCQPRTGSEWLLPVLESRPAKTMGSSAPSSSGSATCTLR